MVNDGRYDAFESLSTATCSECNQLVGNTKKQRAAGGATVTEGWSIVAVRRAKDFDQTGKVSAGISAARSVATFESGGKERVTPPDDFIIQLHLKKDSGSWSVDDLDFLS